ncbi:MAG TPA: hypothetical protein VJH70_03255 [Candidatus Paceibacterota bacterium]
MSMNIDPSTLSEEEQKTMMWEIASRKFGLGIGLLHLAAEEVKKTGKRVAFLKNPEWPTGQDLIKVMSSDLLREMCEEKFGVAFGLYEGCGLVAAPFKNQLRMGYAEQIRLLKEPITSS